MLGRRFLVRTTPDTDPAGTRAAAL